MRTCGKICGLAAAIAIAAPACAQSGDARSSAARPSTGIPKQQPSSASRANSRPTPEQLDRMILNRNAPVRVEAVSHDRISTRRIDIVDENGTIRMTLSAPTPEPIFDGIQYRRAFPVSGLTIYDENGSERGGYGVADIPGGAAVMALDHTNIDAVGFRVMPDGSVSFIMNEAPPVVRAPDLGNRRLIATSATSRIRMNVAANGAPTVELADANDAVRVRLAITPEGYGAIEFLDAQGVVVSTIAPERDRARSKSRGN